MSSPSPFDVSRAIGQNLAPVQRGVRERSIIEDILSRSQEAKSSPDIQTLISEAMSRLGPESQPQVLQALQSRAKQAQMQEDYSRAGVDPSLANLPPALQAAKMKQMNAGAGERSATTEGGKGAEEFEKATGKNVASYMQKIQQDADDAMDLQYSLDIKQQAIEGDIAGPGMMAAVKNNPYLSLLVGLTPDEQALRSTNQELLQNSKGIFGSRPTEKEIFLLLNQMLPSIGKTREANMAGLEYIRRINDIKLQRAEILDELTQGGTLYVPNIQSQVNERMKPVIEDLREQLKEDAKQQAQEKSEKGKPKKPLNPSEALIQQARKSRGE